MKVIINGKEIDLDEGIDPKENELEESPSKEENIDLDETLQVERVNPDNIQGGNIS